ncbi:MAG: polymer-forming cytoskeletal protein [Thermoanaerobaculia bacterium]
MWKKNEPVPEPTTPKRAPTAPSRRAASPASVIGPSIFIKGDLSGQEDLVIQGRLEGEVQLKANNVTVGRDGRIRADIYGRSVYVEGEVKGHLFGKQEVVIRASGKVQGDIVSPRVVLENGSNFKGSIDMEPAAAPQASETPESPAQTEIPAKPAVAAPGPAKSPGVATAKPPAGARGAAGKAGKPSSTPAAGNRT